MALLRTHSVRISLWVCAALSLLASVLALTIYTAPRWAAGWIRDEALTRIERRFEMPVTLGDLEVDWQSARLTDLRIGPHEDPLVRVDAATFELDSSAWWSGEVHVENIAVQGGAVKGTRAQLEELAGRVLSRRKEPTQAKGRLRLIPESLSVDDFTIDVADGARTVQTTLSLRAKPRDKTAELDVRDLAVSLGTGPSLLAAHVRTALELKRSEDGALGLAFPLRFDIDNAGVPITDAVALAGVDGAITIEDDGFEVVEIDLSGGFSDRQGKDEEALWSVVGRLHTDRTRGSVRLQMEPFELRRVPEVLERLPFVESEDATVGGNLAVVFGAGVVRLEGDLAVEGVNIDHPRLARETVRGVGFEVGFAAEIDPDAHMLVIDRAHARRGDLELQLTGSILHPPRREDRRYALRVRVPPVPCQALIDDVPAELIPSLQGFVLDGTFDADVRTQIDFADLEALELTGYVAAWNCRPKEVPPDASPKRLNGGFIHRVVMRDGAERAVHIFPGSPSFTPLSMISPYMVAAVMTTEDGGFYRHRGFLPSQIRAALQRNLEEGKIVLGASTITMQMVKNVLLSHERTLSRKLQELFLTWYVEIALGKDRIMEIYLNAIEYGPGIYGITAAARHYFGKHPSELKPPEAVYLALMLPSPVRRHVHYCRDMMSGAFKVKHERILRIMYERERLSEFEYLLWQGVLPTFDPTDRGTEAECLAEIERLLSATAGQYAVTGLLGDGAEQNEEMVRSQWTASGTPSGNADPANPDVRDRPALDPDDEADEGVW